MNRKLILSLLPLLFFSCKKEDTPVALNTSAVSVADIQVLTPKLLRNDTLTQGDKTFNLLGYGYDVTGKYADSSAVRGKAIDVVAFNSANPARTGIDSSTAATAATINAKDAATLSAALSSNLAASAGLKLFKGSITAAFPGQDPLSKQYAYGKYTVYLRQRRVSLNAGNDLLQNFLTPQFKTDVATLSAQALVAKYGTHVLSDVLLGAKFNILYQAAITDTVERNTDATVGFRYALNNVFHIFTGSFDQTGLYELSKVASPVVTFDAVGADASKINVNSNGKITTIDITAWQASATESSARFIDIPQNGLIVLSDLIADPNRKLVVQNYITGYLAAQQVRVTN